MQYFEGAVLQRAVYAINAGNVTLNLDDSGWLGYIQVGNVKYKHIMPASIHPDRPTEIVSEVESGHTIAVGDFLGQMYIGTANNLPLHVHIDNRIVGTNFINNGVKPFSDTQSPDLMYPFNSTGTALNTGSADAVEFRANGYRSNNTNTDELGENASERVTVGANGDEYKIIYDKVDIIIRARDRWIETIGTGYRRNNGINQASYRILDAFGNNVDNHSYQNINFNNVPDDIRAQYVFDNSAGRSSQSRHVYILTGNPHYEPYDRYWNPKLREGTDIWLISIDGGGNKNWDTTVDYDYASTLFDVILLDNGDLLFSAVKDEANRIVNLKLVTPNPTLDETLEICENVASGNSVAGQAKNIVVSDGCGVVFEPGSSTNLVATESITLKAGTHIKAGSFFTAWVDEFLVENCDILQAGRTREFDQEDNTAEEIKGQSKITIYPNPNNGAFEIDLSAFDSQDYSMTLHQINGYEVWSGVGYSNGGLEMIQTDNLPSGIYILNVNLQKDGRHHVKVLITQ